MRNLKLQFCNQIDSRISDIKFLLTDPSGGKKDAEAKLFLITSNKIYATNEKFQNVKELSKTIVCDSSTHIVGAEFLALNDEICIATADGRVLSIAPETGTLNENSFCDVGLVSMTWSPEQEVVVFITKTLNVVVMTCTYDPICEHILQEQCDQQHQQFINVGWGRKETQFHGSEGKNAAKKSTYFEKPKDMENVLQDVETSWRYDGAYFAVSFVSLQYGRMFKVFDKEGTLQYTSEKMNGLQPTISWRPSGTWIAMPHELPNKCTVALFEKNGLRHREILLPFKFVTEKIVSLKWSTESDILAIQTELTGKEDSACKQFVYLYTIGNYHWYLKQTLSFNPGEHIVALQFGNDATLERTLYIMLNTGQYLKYSWFFGVDKLENDGIVAVIDGPKLLLTNLSKAIVPPPMSGSQIQIDCNINNCTTLEDKERNELYLCLYDMNGCMHLYKTEFAIPNVFKMISTLKPDKSLECSTYSYLANITLCPNDYLIATCCKNYATSFLLIALDKTDTTYSIKATLSVDGIVNALHFDNVGKQIFAHTLNGCIRPLELQSSRIMISKEHVRLPHAATQILSFVVNGISSTIALCNNQSLYIDDQHMADYVTSICLEGGNYLAFTKHSELCLVRLNTGRRAIDNVRSIESGGKLIAICTSTSRTVLQLPRGNLETFYPRLLLLDRVGHLLDCHMYERVMDLLVKQRINLNIICDHNINAFVSNINIFAEDIRNVNWLNLFLSDLRNEDITRTMYANSYTRSKHVYPPDFHMEDKVKYICEKMLAYMENSENCMRFSLPIITAKIKMGNLEGALELIWQLKKQESGNGKSQSEEALKYLLYLVDVNELYDVALGTYDFGLVLFVAQKSQRDPREFLPFLNKLKELDVNYRKFKIDEHLKRYEKALCNISKCSEPELFEEALEFIVRHQLYSEALKCYEGVSDRYKRVCLAYADFLRAAGKLDNASLLYERGGYIPQALRCSKHVLDWQRVLYLAHKENPENVADAALSIVPALQEKRMYSEAYYLLKTYGNDFMEALDCLLKGNLYLRAIYEVCLHEDDVGVLDRTILPNLCSYVELLQTNLADSQNTFTDYKRRLVEVRAQREKQNNETDVNGWATEDVFDESDLLSDTTSMRSSHYTGSSRGTGKTFRSSKNRRKHERKHFSLKPGNPFEDIALIDALYGHIVKVFEQQEHIRDTCKALLELQQDELATQLQTCYKKLITLIQSALDEIWIAELASGAQKVRVDENIDYKLFQNEQRYALLDPLKRHKPHIKLEEWEHAILT